MPTVLLRLLVCHPSRIAVSALRAHGHQMESIAAAIVTFSRRVVWKSERAGLPGLLPWRCALFQHLDNRIGHLLAEITPRWDGGRCYGSFHYGCHGFTPIARNPGPAFRARNRNRQGLRRPVRSGALVARRCGAVLRALGKAQNRCLVA